VLNSFFRASQTQGREESLRSVVWRSSFTGFDTLWMWRFVPGWRMSMSELKYTGQCASKIEGIEKRLHASRNLR
jgi:hypothetical protein